MIEDILAVALLFGGGTLVLLAMSPIGRALADRIRAPRPPAGDAQLDALQDELQQLRQEIGELAERIDFMERLRAASREPDRLAAPPAHSPSTSR